jgi:ABC-type proline/glycine betaine transport system permease subunit
MALLLSNTILNIVISAEALYLRAHKQEKFLLISVLGALLVSLSTYFLGKAYGSFGMVAGALSVSLFVGLPLGTLTLQKYRRLWHAE